MAKVMLKATGPRSLTTHGMTFLRGTVNPNVDEDIARQLKMDHRFNVTLNTNSPAGTADASSATQPAAPSSSVEKARAIKEAIDQLDVDDPSSFTADGKPDARALSKILGWVVTSKDRDAALGLQDTSNNATKPTPTKSRTAQGRAPKPQPKERSKKAKPVQSGNVTLRRRPKPDAAPLDTAGQQEEVEEEVVEDEVEQDNSTDDAVQV